jgi:hypothetical protein
MSSETDARLARLREKSRALTSSMRDHEDRLNRISSRLADTQSSAMVQERSRNSSALRTSAAFIHSPPHQSPLRASALNSPIQPYLTSSESEKKVTEGIMDAAKDYVHVMSDKNIELEELRRLMTVTTVKLRLAQEEADRFKEAEKAARNSCSEMSVVIEKMTGRVEDHEATKKELVLQNRALERSLELSKQMVEKYQQELTSELMKREDADSAKHKAEEKCCDLLEKMKVAAEQEGAVRTDLRAERLEFIESQKLLRQDTMTLTHEMTAIATENSNLRAKVATLERATVGTSVELKQLKALHSATVQQLLGTRDRLREEQLLRRKLEADIARYRGIMNLSGNIVNEGN